MLHRCSNCIHTRRNQCGCFCCYYDLRWVLEFQLLVFPRHVCMWFLYIHSCHYASFVNKSLNFCHSTRNDELLSAKQQSQPSGLLLSHCDRVPNRLSHYFSFISSLHSNCDKSMSDNHSHLAIDVGSNVLYCFCDCFDLNSSHCYRCCKCFTSNNWTLWLGHLLD